MIEETMPPEDILEGDEIRISVGGEYGWHKVVKLEPILPGTKKAIFYGGSRNLTATLYKVRRYS